LGKEGYTQQLFEIVRTHNNVDGVKPFERIVNHRGWPLPKLDVKARAALKQTSRTIELPRPADLDESLHPDFIASPAFFSSAKSAAHRFAWARGMTEMRKLQVDKANGVVARIVLGGTFGPTPKVAEDGTKSTTWYSGRIPGVLEEGAALGDRGTTRVPHRSLRRRGGSCHRPVTRQTSPGGYVGVPEASALRRRNARAL
jgi:hypothetical protein